MILNVRSWNFDFKKVKTFLSPSSQKLSVKTTRRRNRNTFSVFEENGRCTFSWTPVREVEKGVRSSHHSGCVEEGKSERTRIGVPIPTRRSSLPSAQLRGQRVYPVFLPSWESISGESLFQQALTTPRHHQSLQNRSLNGPLASSEWKGVLSRITESARIQWRHVGSGITAGFMDSTKKTGPCLLEAYNWHKEVRGIQMQEDWL